MKNHQRKCKAVPGTAVTGSATLAPANEVVKSLADSLEETDAYEMSASGAPWSTIDTIFKDKTNSAHIAPVLRELDAAAAAASTPQGMGRVVKALFMFLITITRKDELELDDDEWAMSNTRSSYAKRIRHGVQRWTSGKGVSDYLERVQTLQAHRGHQRHVDNEDNKTQRAEAFVRGGALSKAAQALNSQGIAKGTEQDYIKTKDKFPSATAEEEAKYAAELQQVQGAIGPIPPNWEPVMTIDDEVIFGTISRLSRTTAADHSGVKADHLKFVCWSGFTRLITRITRAYLTGALPADVQAYLGSSRIVPLWKDEAKTDIRPVTVPSLIARIAAKCVNKLCGADIGSTLAPLQIGVNRAKAIETMSVLVRSTLARNPDCVLLAADIKNAYGTTNLSSILSAVSEQDNKLLLQYFLCRYASPSTTSFRRDDGTFEIIKNKNGVLQGDCLSGLFFSLALQPALRALDEKDYKLVIAYLDDIYIVCSKEQALELTRGGLQKVLDDKQIGLKVNIGKTSVFSPSGDLGDEDNWECKLQRDGCVVLGTPIGTAEFISTHLKRTLDEFKRVTSSFTKLQAQSALLLLRGCGITRLNHLFRTTPSALSAPIAGRANDHIWATLQAILDIPSDGEAAELHFNHSRARTASNLPISMGGLGMTNPFDALPGAFLAGLKDGIQSLAQHFEEDHDWWTTFLESDSVDSFLALDQISLSAKRSLQRVRTGFEAFKTTTTFTAQRSKTGTPLTEAETSARYPLTIANVLTAEDGLQHRLTWMLLHNKHREFQTSLPASLRALAIGHEAPHAQDFLIMHPSCKAHQLSSDDMKFGARLLLYLPPTNEDYLQMTPSQVLRDVSGPRDAFVKFRSLFRAAHAWPRHDSLIQLFDLMLKKSGYRTRLEVHVPNAGAQNRVDIVAYGLFHNTDVAFDVSVIAADSVNIINQTSAEAGFAAGKRARQKEVMYTTACRAQNFTFRPLILEDTGFLDANVTALFAQLSKSDQFEESVPEFTTWAARKALDYWYQGVSRHLVAGNAKMFRGMRPDWAGLRGRPSRWPRQV